MTEKPKPFWSRDLFLRVDGRGFICINEPSAKDNLWRLEYREIRRRTLEILEKKGPLSASGIVHQLIETRYFPSLPPWGEFTRDDQGQALEEADRVVFSILKRLSATGHVVSDGTKHRPIRRRQYSLGTALDRLSGIARPHAGEEEVE